MVMTHLIPTNVNLWQSLTLNQQQLPKNNIGALRSQNTSDTSSRKEYDKFSANNPVHYEGDYDIVSHHKSIFLVQFHIGQEEGRKKMVAYTALKTIGDPF